MFYAARFIFCLFFITIASTATLNPRLISLLNVVTFRNSPCTAVSSTASSSRQGTCFSSEECSQKGGQIDGTCASGFGVCCIFKLVACGGAISQYSNELKQSNCQPISIDICRIRLDFKTLQLRQAPTATGVCGNENIAVTSTSRNNIPSFCGILTNQHMYITTAETGDLGAFALNFDTADVTTTRSWDIKVTQVACDDTLSLPPDGCLQYFTGLSGNVKSYNFGVLLASTAYDSCIRNERGFCSVRYTESATAVPDPFIIGADAAGRTDGSNCADARLVISGSVSSVVCGNFLTQVDASMMASQVIANNVPFNLRLETTNTLNAQTGYNLDYTQIPC
ncbi:unnamed protein product [Lepeophtheirus salmonis]|uniref:(salmon louse) hypothetical protein n=1 Tax=Lepeophtheirus salmonis TaxID=72036 RepID=A0A7R8CIQ1_LEPSM|nr:unnamed protein product [Lepeophtheirus salmonis]CAF2780251.1 unnamed protein product [Lepeophtheirus salmonis]